MDLNIDPKDVIELAAQKVADAVLGDNPDLLMVTVALAITFEKKLRSK